MGVAVRARCWSTGFEGGMRIDLARVERLAQEAVPERLSRQFVGESCHKAVSVIGIGWAIAPLRVPLTAESPGPAFATLAEVVIHLLRPGVGNLAGHAMPATGRQLGIQGVVVIAAIRVDRPNRFPAAGSRCSKRTRLVKRITVQVCAL